MQDHKHKSKTAEGLGLTPEGPDIQQNIYPNRYHHNAHTAFY